MTTQNPDLILSGAPRVRQEEVVESISERLHDHCSSGLADEWRRTHTKDIHHCEAKPKDQDAQEAGDEGDPELLVFDADDVLASTDKSHCDGAD